MSVQGICTPLGHRRAWNWSFGGKKPSEEQPEATSFETEIIDHVPESEAQGDSAEAPVDSGTAYQDTFVDEAVEGGGSKSLIAFAKVNRIPVSPKKVHELMLRVRGLGCQEAMIQMKLSRKGNAKYIHGLIQQAVGNALHNFNMNQDRLVIKEIYYGRATPVKKVLIQGRGRASVMQKRRSHLFIKVAEQPYQEGEYKIGRYGRNFRKKPVPVEKILATKEKNRKEKEQKLARRELDYESMIITGQLY